MQSLKQTIPIAILFYLLLPNIGNAQSFRRGGVEFEALRDVDIGSNKTFDIVVTEFFHHGLISPDGRNVAVAAKNQLVPCRVLQLGPGDFCRIAFQPIKGQTEYSVFYGGSTPSEKIPDWTSKNGLLLETRHFKQCNMQSLDSIRKAFDTSNPYGSDYVEGVFHGTNPFSLKREPFLSKYSGYIDIAAAGTYGFMTSSQDASFLLIDDKPVVSAPGRHAPLLAAFRNTRQDVELSAGLHKFEYYHATGGSDGIMAAYWEPNPPDSKPQPKIIPPTVFHSQLIAHLPAKSLALKNTKLVPDFTIKIIGDVTLPDNDMSLINVSFHNDSPITLINQGNVHWNFGDGQTSDELSPKHVFLMPGLYNVKLAFRYNGRNIEIANRIEVEKPALDHKDKPHTIDDYLKLLETYNLDTLDTGSLRQLVEAYLLKSSQLRNRSEDLKSDIENGPNDPNRKPPDEKEKQKIKKEIDSLIVQSRKYMVRAIDAGKTPFIGKSSTNSDNDLLLLAKRLDPLIRGQLGEFQTALDIWEGAGKAITNPALQAECDIAASDIIINEINNPKQAKPLLDRATASLQKTSLNKDNSSPSAATLQRIWGDYYAATSDGNAARNAYNSAEKLIDKRRNFIQRTAWKGAHSRSAEEFLNTNQLDRAAEELYAWQREFPSEKIDGYLTLLFAKYWASRAKYKLAIAQAEQLHTVNTSSAYLDQILFLAAECELRLDRKDRAIAILNSITKDCPGSPLVPGIRKRIEELEKNEASK